MYSNLQKYAAELIGTAFLLATVVGSGIMAENLAGGNIAIALLGNTIPTGAILVVLITMLGPISGAHFNPAVTLIFVLKKEISVSNSAMYVLLQIIGGILGVWVAHLMFDIDVIQFSEKARTGNAQWIAEIVATFGLVFTILATLKSAAHTVPMAVGLYITAAYWFTASTSFANPAVTIARGFSNTFAGINPDHIFGFIIAQLIGAILALAVCSFLLSSKKQSA
ncbi:MIP/aquaporin family protein [Hyphomicrobiales bacterium 4NK60-0047b]|jgi:glycerol uptake facilitator-like aquaporin